MSFAFYSWCAIKAIRELICPSQVWTKWPTLCLGRREGRGKKMGDKDRTLDTHPLARLWGKLVKKYFQISNSQSIVIISHISTRCHWLLWILLGKWNNQFALDARFLKIVHFQMMLFGQWRVYYSIHSHWNVEENTFLLLNQHCACWCPGTVRCWDICRHSDDRNIGVALEGLTKGDKEVGNPTRPFEMKGLHNDSIMTLCTMTISCSGCAMGNIYDMHFDSNHTLIWHHDLVMYSLRYYSLIAPRYVCGLIGNVAWWPQDKETKQ